VAVALLLSGCEGILKFDVVGDGNSISIRRNLAGIENNKVLELQDDFMLEIYQSDTRELYVECDANLNGYIETEVEYERLIINRRNNFELSSRNPLKLKLYIDTLDVVYVYNEGALLCDTLNFDQFEIVNYGASSIISRFITANRLTYFSEGRSKANINGFFKDLKVRQLGSGESVISGTANILTVIQEGSGEVDAYGLTVHEADVALYGSGIIFCKPDDLLHVKIVGNGRVFYKGNPQTTSSVEGGGSLINEGF
jgi:hypothetical protein